MRIARICSIAVSRSEREGPDRLMRPPKRGSACLAMAADEAWIDPSLWPSRKILPHRSRLASSSNAAVGLVDVVGQRQHLEHLQIRRRVALRHVDAGADLVEADRSDAARLQRERELRAAAVPAGQQGRRPVAVGRPAPGEEHDARRGAVARRQGDRRGQRVARPVDDDVLARRGVIHRWSRERTRPRSDTISMLDTLQHAASETTPGPTCFAVFAQSLGRPLTVTSPSRTGVPARRELGISAIASTSCTSALRM